MVSIIFIVLKNKKNIKKYLIQRIKTFLKKYKMIFSVFSKIILKIIRTKQILNHIRRFLLCYQPFGVSFRVDPTADIKKPGL